MKKTFTGTLILMLSLAMALLFYSFEKEDSRFHNGDTGYEVMQKWELPEELKEISGIEWLGDNRIAAIQDEDGTIFIYDLDNRKIEQKIEFGDAGDYEGLSISGNTAFVLRSDGTVFEIKDYTGPNPSTSAVETSLSKIKGIDVEGLSLDEANNRLLLAVKENEEEKDTRGVYALNLDDRTSDRLFEVRLSDPVLKKAKGKFNPSEIEIHPETGEYYILDARNPKLVILGKDGKPRSLEILAESDFSKPEGLSFTPEGSLYISNEAGDGPANILLVDLR